MMAEVQHNKGNVRHVLDYREQKAHVDAFTAHADVCSQKLREWRQEGSEVTVLDLRKAYLQVHMHRSLLPFQTVLIDGQRYYLTRMGIWPYGGTVHHAHLLTLFCRRMSANDEEHPRTLKLYT